MIPMYSPTQSRHIQILAGGVLCLFISGCAHQQSEPSLPTEAEICQSLDYAIKQAASDFKDIRLNVTPDYVMNRWDTKPIFPETDCDVFDWGGGRFTYNCLWKESDQATAKKQLRSQREARQPVSRSGLARFGAAGKNRPNYHFFEARVGYEDSIALFPGTGTRHAMADFGEYRQARHA